MVQLEAEISSLRLQLEQGKSAGQPPFGKTPKKGSGGLSVHRYWIVLSCDVEVNFAGVRWLAILLLYLIHIWMGTSIGI